MKICLPPNMWHTLSLQTLTFRIAMKCFDMPPFPALESSPYARASWRPFRLMSVCVPVSISPPKSLIPDSCCFLSFQMAQTGETTVMLPHNWEGCILILSCIPPIGKYLNSNHDQKNLPPSHPQIWVLSTGEHPQTPALQSLGKLTVDYMTENLGLFPSSQDSDVLSVNARGLFTLFLTSEQRMHT